MPKAPQSGGSEATVLDGSEHRDTHEVSTGYGYLQDKFNFS